MVLVCLVMLVLEALKKGARIENVDLVNVNITGRSTVGGLMGRKSFGLVRNVSVSGQIQGLDQVGGVLGVESRGTTINVQSTITVNGRNTVGGLVGILTGTGGRVLDSFSEGTVTSTSGSSIGGLVGVNTGSCYAARCVGIIDFTTISYIIKQSILSNQAANIIYTADTACGIRIENFGIILYNNTSQTPYTIFTAHAACGIHIFRKTTPAIRPNQAAGKMSIRA